MRQVRSSDYFLVLASLLFVMGCNQTATTPQQNEQDTTPVTAANDMTSVPAYDPAMDSYNMAGVEKIKDTLGIKMYEVSVKPGETFALHAHPDHIAYVLQGGTAILYIKEAGSVDTISFPTGFGLVSGPLSDSGKNIGKTTIKMLVADIYRPRK